MWNRKRSIFGKQAQHSTNKRLSYRRESRATLWNDGPLLANWKCGCWNNFSGSSFQIRGPETLNAWLPTVASRNIGTTRRLELAEWSARRPCRSTTRSNGPRYRGAVPCRTLYVSTAILYWMCSGTRSQFRLTSRQIGCQPDEHSQHLPLAYIYTRCCNRLNYRTASMRCCMSHIHVTLTSAVCVIYNVVDNTLRQRTVVHADYRGEWTLIFGITGVWTGDFSTGRKNAIFYLPTCIWRLAPPLGVIPSKFRRYLLHHKTRVPGLSCGVVCVILLLAIFCRISSCDRQTNRRTDGHAMTADTGLA